MSSYQKETREEGCFSFGDIASITEGDLIMFQKLMGAQEYKDGRSYPWPQRAEHDYELKRKKYGGGAVIFDRPLPSDKSWAMAKYRHEMMMEVESILDGTYELSLRDMVELKSKVEEKIPDKEENTEQNRGNRDWELKGHIFGSTVAHSSRFLLKMSLPFLFNRRKKSAGAAGAKVTPKLSLSATEKAVMESSGSDDGGSISRSRRKSGCYSFLSVGRR